jgi:hypothetical protein
MIISAERRIQWNARVKTFIGLYMRRRSAGVYMGWGVMGAFGGYTI